MHAESDFLSSDKDQERAEGERSQDGLPYDGCEDDGGMPERGGSAFNAGSVVEDPPEGPVDPMSKDSARKRLRVPLYLPRMCLHAVRTLVPPRAGERSNLGNIKNKLILINSL